CSQIEHRFQIDEGLRSRTSFTNKTRPHRIVDFRILEFSAHVLMASPYRARIRSAHDLLPFFFTNGSASGLPGPKCFNNTKGSVSLRFWMRTPCLAASELTNNSSCVI